MNENSTIGPTSFSFSGIAWGKVGAGIGVAVAGAVLTYLTTWIGGQDFGPMWTPVIMTFWSAIAVVVRKWTSNIQ
jgi:hypothetical protein